MHLLDRVKHIAATGVAVLAIGAIAISGVDAQAKTVDQPKQTYKYTTLVGESIDLHYITNLKINGKKYTKGSIKKKVKTVQTGKNVDYWNSYNGDYIEYFDSDDVPDTEAHKAQQQNYKRIYMQNYNLTFLKAGQYKITYDKYSSGTSEKVKLDAKTYKVTPVLEKTSYEETYKVLETTSPIKSVKLGKTTRKYTTTRSGSKVTEKVSIKNRYLKGASGKLVMKMNKNYKLTSAFAVTYDAAGNQVITPVANNQKVTFSAGKFAGVKTVDKIVQDAKGDVTVTDPTTGDTYVQMQTVTTKEYNSKYKTTAIYYGYADKFTGDYLTYSIGTKTVYTPVKDQYGKQQYQKDATGKNINNPAYGNRSVPMVNAITATVITRKYPIQTRVNGTYQTVEVVEEKVILPTDKTLKEGEEYFEDAMLDISGTSGVWKEVSKGGIAKYVVGTDVYKYESAYSDLSYTMVWNEKWENPAYDRAFYYDDEDYRMGSWVQYVDGMTDYAATSYDIDLATGDYTTKWVYQYTKDAAGEYVDLPDNNNYVQGLSSIEDKSGIQYFNAK